MPRPRWDPTSLPDLRGRTYLVTGANAGVGYFTCEQLARAGARVIMTGRSPNRLAAARAALLRRVPDAVTAATVDTLLLDTSNLGSVRAAAASVTSRDRLDGLLLNAGIVHPPRRRETTGDGHEVILATNVLGHFALAASLLTMLSRSAGPGQSRIVWTGSISTSLWRYDPADHQLAEGYTAWRAYVQSKVMVQALAFEADRRLRAADMPVASLLVHPGYSIGGRTPGIVGVNEPTKRKRFADNLQAAFTQSKEHGAWAPVRALTDPDAAGGDFFGPRFVVRGEPRAAHATRVTRSAELGARVWQVCEEATGMRWPLPG